MQPSVPAPCRVLKGVHSVIPSHLPWASPRHIRWQADQRATKVLVPALLTVTARLLSQHPGRAWRRSALRAISRKSGQDELPHGGPTVVISGASQGTGRALALKFAQDGFNVVLAARDPENLLEAERLCQETLKPGRLAMAVPCDITSPESVQLLCDSVAERFTDLRVVVCNAGVCMTGEFADTSLEDFQSQMNVNFLGHVATVRAFLPLLLQHNGSSNPAPTVCFVNSFGARVPLPGMTAYCAAKYALQGFADSLRLELTSKGVHVATVHPGVIRSDFRTRAQWRGSAAGSRRSMMNTLLDGQSPVSGVTQSVEEVAEAAFEAVKTRQNEVVVGLPFRTMLAAYGFGKALGIA
ncbi:unnamed protein product [Symbiodinium natans]|uniref:Uncharacterized protein n=1 Tax=Symbiodinium natans TaxID=878477 RepID=A0A812RGE7_9DINO|nr:unnamed protein product [Symbiodinium natans]